MRWGSKCCANVGYDCKNSLNFRLISAIYAVEHILDTVNLKKNEKSFKKIWWNQKKFVTLHSQNGKVP